MKVKLIDICDFQGGSQPPKDEWKGNYINGYIRMLQIRDFTQKNKVIPEYVKISNSLKFCEADDILIARYGASVGKILTGLSGAYNVAIMKIIPDTTRLNKRYLKYFLESRSFQDFIKNVGSRAAQAGFNKSDLSSIFIEERNINEQNKIINILDKLTSLIELKKNQLEKMNLFVKSLFIEMFNDPIKNNMNWEVKKLKDLCLKIGSGATPKGGQSVYIDKGTSFIRSMNVYNGYFKYNGLAHINENHAQQLENVSLKENDILLNITGASVARSCIVPKNLLPARVNQHVALIRVNQEKINPIFLNHVFITDSFQKYLLNISASNGATRQAITKQQIEELNIIVPSSKLVDLYVKKVQQIDKSKYASGYVKLIFIQNKILNIFFS